MHTPIIPPEQRLENNPKVAPRAPSLVVQQVTATLPPRILVHGQEGTGKTTLAARFPRPIFLQTEDGTPAGVTLSSFGLLETYSAVRDALKRLATEEHDFQTVAIDALDELEGMIWADVCATR